MTIDDRTPDPALEQIERLTRERDEARRALDRVYRDLCVLEPTLTKEQIALCPVNATKWEKQPEFSERDAWHQTPEGAEAQRLQFEARCVQLAESRAVNDLLHLRDVEDELNVSRATLFRWIKSGRLQAVKVGSYWRVRRSVIESMRGDVHE